MALALTLATVASAQTYTVLKSFNGQRRQYAACGRGLGGQHALWDDVYGGSSYSTNWVGYGVVFKVNTDGSGYAVLKSFTAAMARVRGEAWSWLAARSMGRRAEGSGDLTDGVVFKVNTDGSGYAVLKSFNGSDGALPYAEPGLGGQHALWDDRNKAATGAVLVSRWTGVVFKVNTDGSGYTVLKNFTGSDGSGPVAGLVLAGNTLYGTTPNGGSSLDQLQGIGVVFKVNTDGSGYTVLKSFTGSDGDCRRKRAWSWRAARSTGRRNYGGSSTNGGDDHGMV